MTKETMGAADACRRVLEVVRSPFFGQRSDGHRKGADERFHAADDGAVSDRLAQLDGFRAVAILAVFAAHAEVAPGGHLGVVVFFVLSGYLITGLLIREVATTGGINLRRFLVRRAARLLPALLLVLAIAGPLVVWMDGPAQIVGVIAALFYSTDVVAAFGGQAVVGHTSWAWTLSLEEKFYVVWPVVLLAFLRARRSAIPWLLVLMACCAALRTFLPLTGEPPSQVYFAPWSRVDALAAGCVLALCAGRLRLRPWMYAGLAFGSASALVVLTLLAQWTGRVTYAVYVPLALLASMGLLVALVGQPDGLLTRVLQWRPLAYLGRISYGLYLWNIPVIVVVWALPLPRVPSAVLWLAATIGIAAASFHLVEVPLQKRINARWARSAAVVGG
jgi:peptidoglycan/LPS O-acetylase OafA/YrhL